MPDQVSQVYVNAPAGISVLRRPRDHQFLHRPEGCADFSPRLGLVYNPDGNGKTTIRVGAGLLYDYGRRPSFRTAWSLRIRPSARRSPTPAAPTSSATRGAMSPEAIRSRSRRRDKNVAFPPANAEVFLPPHIHAPSVGQWNFSVQHRFSDNWVASVSYLGNKTSHLWIGNEINPAVYIPGTCGSAACSSTGNTQARRVLSLANPKAGQYYSTMIVADDGISANYNGLLASIEHRFAQQLSRSSPITPGRNAWALPR